MIWAVYLALSIGLWRWNPHAAAAFSLHLIAMQGVKLTDPAGHQVLYFAVHSASALLAAVFLDKLAGGMLAAIALIYAAHLAGLPQGFKLFAAEGLFLVGILLTGISGPSGGLMDLARDPHHDRPDGVADGAQGAPEGAALLEADRAAD